ncbi:hypothetical protein PF0101 [Pyrococcus furiosus DSM 3638]|uniref:4Fe4S-binding SPASM domain-containing protein n=1 Tax=Pyrococcus furiosus (strain ATCC 43587 / DSM 3638 / JCM 8422 / Vc1) TaxID=186497 RepID=Q8U4I6_PYRFU|nr:hypothetical protein PF0101 [Pyrococcus furiosus DSM 3638]MDK2869758.1 hypothetical protein [Pyrococcus sp.]
MVCKIRIEKVNISLSNLKFLVSPVAESKVLTSMSIIESKGITTIGKPPWVLIPHAGQLERIILAIGKGKGKFSESKGITRSIGCIGNNEFILYREKIGIEKFKEILKEFYKLTPEGEVFITNYDSIEEGIELAEYSANLGLTTYLTVMSEDYHSIPQERKFKVILEVTLEELNHQIPDVDVLLLIVPYSQYNEIKNLDINFSGEIWVDIVYPPSARYLSNGNLFEIRRIVNPASITYHPCMAGLVAVSPEGFVTPCPLLRKFIVGDITKESLKAILRKQRLKKTWWKLTKDKIPQCKSCTFRYICHDCRALEYSATGEIFGTEYCSL